MFLLFGRDGFFCCQDGGVFFCCFGGELVCFAVWARVSFCFLFGRGLVLFLLFARRTGVHSLSGLPVWALRGLTTKKTKQQTNENTGSLPLADIEHWGHRQVPLRKVHSSAEEL